MNQLFRDVEGASLCPQGSVVCIGAFDGLHLGHQALIGRAVARAHEIGLESVALSFEPLPREFFAGTSGPPRLLSARAKYEGLAALGVDRVGLLRFDAHLAAMSGEEFCERVLVRRLSAQEVWIGPEFRFGKGRLGDFATLSACGARYGFVAREVAPTVVYGDRVSSTAIRAMLGAGELDAAQRRLGRRYSIAGKVVGGQQLGRELGYPTANLRLGRRQPALGGVFATRIHGAGLEGWPSVSSLGTRPTVNGTERLLEAHLFDFDGDLYGRRIEVEFVARLRDEVRFDGLPALTAQMHRDAAQAREILCMAERRHGAMA